MISADNKDMDGVQTTDGAVRAPPSRASPSAARLIGDPQLTVNARSLQSSAHTVLIYILADDPHRQGAPGRDGDNRSSGVCGSGCS